MLIKDSDLNDFHLYYQHTSKINDPVRFYEDIDLNPFVYVGTKKGDNEESKDGNNIEYNRKKPNLHYNHLPIDFTGMVNFHINYLVY